MATVVHGRMILPTGSRVIHRARAAFPLIQRAVDVVKLYDSETGESYRLASDPESGAAMEIGALDELAEQEARRLNARYGRIHPSLFDRMADAPEGATFPVAVWLVVDEEPVDKSEFRREPGDDCEYPPLTEYRTVVERAVAKGCDLLSERHSVEVEGRLRTAPVLFATISAKQVRRLARRKEIAGLYLNEVDVSLDLGDSLAISGAARVVNQQAWRGTNIRVAVWEDAPDDASNLVIADRFDPRPRASDHARLVTGIIRNNQANPSHGYAPESLIYSANVGSQDAFEWAVVTHRCRIVNQSFHRDGERLSGTLSFDDILKDYFATHSPFPMIVQAAGNVVGPSDPDFVNHKGFNSITVGSHDDLATSIDAFSTDRSPPSPHNDRKLPEIAANGNDIDAVGTRKSGTSYAAPAVAGSVALLHNMDNTLFDWPEATRAILLAGARLRPRRADVDARGKDAVGCGALDIDESGAIARSRRPLGSGASLRGWDHGSLAPRNFDAQGRAGLRYPIAVPPKGGARRIKAAVAWNSEATQRPGSHRTSTLTLDLDLFLLDDTGSLVASSATFDNSYEVLEFDAQPGKLYTLEIRRSSGTGWSYFGVAWTVFDPKPPDPIHG